jgi:hypothetical protein
MMEGRIIRYCIVHGRSQTNSPKVIQTVFFAQLVVATGDEAQLIRWYTEGGEDRVQELGIVGHSERYGLKGSFASIKKCVNLTFKSGEFSH